MLSYYIDHFFLLKLFAVQRFHWFGCKLLSLGRIYFQMDAFSNLPKWNSLQRQMSEDFCVVCCF